MIKFVALIICIIFTLSIHAQVKLPHLISNGMILQRDTKIKIWGWAAIEEKVTVHFNNKTYNTTTAKDGKWIMTLSSMPAGGPYNIQIDASNHITIKNILIGDVWVCSGQSNMELTMERVKYKYADEVANANNMQIRQFVVPDKYDFNKPHDDVDDGKWAALVLRQLYKICQHAYTK